MKQNNEIIDFLLKYKTVLLGTAIGFLVYEAVYTSAKYWIPIIFLVNYFILNLYKRVKEKD